MKSTKLVFYFIMFLIIFFIPGLNTSFGQASEVIEFNVKSEVQIKGRKTTYNLVVDITRTESSYHSVYVYDKEPWKGGRVIRKEEKINSRNIVISNIAPSRYCVMVLDEKQNLKGSWIEIEPQEIKQN